MIFNIIVCFEMDFLTLWVGVWGAWRPLLMSLFFASPKKSNQKKGDAYAAGGPQRTA